MTIKKHKLSELELTMISNALGEYIVGLKLQALATKEEMDTLSRLNDIFANLHIIVTIDEE